MIKSKDEPQVSNKRAKGPKRTDQRMSDATTTRQETARWPEAVTSKRRSLPAGLLPRLVIGVSGLALGALNIALFLQDGASRALVFSGLLSGGYLVLAYMLVRLRESKLDAEA